MRIYRFHFLRLRICANNNNSSSDSNNNSEKTNDVFLLENLPCARHGGEQCVYNLGGATHWISRRRRMTKAIRYKTWTLVLNRPNFYP